MINRSSHSFWRRLLLSTVTISRFLWYKSSMTPYICATCGVQHAPSEQPPDHCPICEDERQWVPVGGQSWTTLDQMQEAGYRNRVAEQEPGLTGIGTDPQFAIGQRALLVQTPGGNVLWECISYLDDPTVEVVTALGGIDAIAISHPHFYDSMVEWSHAFGNVPIFVHAADRQWVMRPDPVIQFVDTPTRELVPGVSLVHCGGHFGGSTVLHWANGADGRGVLMSSDTLQVARDGKHVSFLYSYPNMIPLSPMTVQHIASTVLQYQFDRIYGIFWESIIFSDARDAVERSRSRYIERVRM